MPDYGLKPPDEGTGLLPWSWALQRLSSSRYYWVCTVGPDRCPHATPVWAVWHDGRVWFSCGPHSRKARNLGAEPRCTVTTNDAANPVVVEGVAERIADPGAIEAVRVAMVAKYDYEVSLDFLLANAVFAVLPAKVIGLVEDDFTGSPTRWRPPFG
jgi:pyridoxamine 5'-phosphate oxidase-like protein